MTVFRVQGFEIRLWERDGRWVVAVEDAVHRHGFRTEAQAAGAGLLRAHRLARRGEAPAASGDASGASDPARREPVVSA